MKEKIYPEVAPTISMDIAMGQRYSNFDVDIQAYTKLLLDAGVKPTDVGKLKIDYCLLNPEEIDPPPEGEQWRGDYNLIQTAAGKSAKVRIFHDQFTTQNEELDQKNHNEMLVHETGHFVADWNSKLSLHARIGRDRMYVLPENIFDSVEKTIGKVIHDDNIDNFIDRYDVKHATVREHLGAALLVGVALPIGLAAEFWTSDLVRRWHYKHSYREHKARQFAQQNVDHIVASVELRKSISDS